MRTDLPAECHPYSYASTVRVLLTTILSIAVVLPAGAEDAPTDFQRHSASFMVQCGKCHTIGNGDRVGPDLKGVTDRRKREWLLGFIAKPSEFLDKDPEAKELLKRFNGVRMEDLGLSPTEIEGFLEFIEAASKGPVGPEEPEALEPEDPADKLAMPDEGSSVSTPGALVMVVLLILAAGFWQFDARAGSAVILVLALGAGYWSFGGRRHHRLIGNQQGYVPQQPIAFSHKQHAGELKIACLYCHHGAEKSDVAGVPSVNICMNCHSAVKKVSATGDESSEIAKLASVWESRETPLPRSVEWVRVHDLPDFVHFSHKDHVRNDIKCQECHGPVQTMETMRQAGSLSMGWCVNCHRGRTGSSRTHWKRTAATLDCTACHL